MTYGNFPTGSLGYQDMTILAINRKPNAERKGPVIPIANFAVAGSRSASVNSCMELEAALYKLSGIDATSDCMQLDALYEPAEAAKHAG